MKPKSKIKSLAASNPINLALARAVVAVVNKGLCEGEDDGTFDANEKPVPGHMCVEAAVCFAMGMPHGDEPKCVHRLVRSFKISLNDSALWNHVEADVTKQNRIRGQVLKRIAVAQLGSDLVGGGFDDALNTIANREFALPHIITGKFDYPGSSILGELVKKHGVSDLKLADLVQQFSEQDASWQFMMQDQSAGDLADTLVNDGCFTALTALKTVADLGVKALREIGSPGVKLMDKLVKEGVIK